MKVVRPVIASNRPLTSKLGQQVRKGERRKEEGKERGTEKREIN